MVDLDKIGLTPSEISEVHDAFSVASDAWKEDM